MGVIHMGLYRVTVGLKFDVGSGGGTNTWHIRTSGTPDSDQAGINAAMSALKDYYTAVAPSVPPSYRTSWNGEALQISVPAPQALASTGWTVNGAGSAADWAFSAIQIVTTWRSAVANRRGRGRTFYGPLDRSCMEGDGTLTTGALARMRTAATALCSASLADTGWAFGVWSATDGVHRDFVSASVKDEGAVLRSRRN
jgi:hypothetical protein